MKCEHKSTRKLFYMDWKKKKWVKTDVSYCLDCKEIVKLAVVKNE